MKMTQDDKELGYFLLEEVVFLFVVRLVFLFVVVVVVFVVILHDQSEY